MSVHSHRNYSNAFFINAEQLDEIASGVMRGTDDSVGYCSHSTMSSPGIRARPAGHRLRKEKGNEVVHRHHDR